MKTCKDCVHLDVCEATYADLMHAGGSTFMDDSENVDKDCRFFKDNTKLIELPCAIGDTVYMTSSGHDDWTGYDFNMVIQASFRLDMLKNWNKRYFLTREEAEKKLEEMKNEKTLPR